MISATLLSLALGALPRSAPTMTLDARSARTDNLRVHKIQTSGVLPWAATAQPSKPEHRPLGDYELQQRPVDSTDLPRVGR